LDCKKCDKKKQQKGWRGEQHQKTERVRKRLDFGAVRDVRGFPNHALFNSSYGTA
jgi:hypothetical protein